MRKFFPKHIIRKHEKSLEILGLNANSMKGLKDNSKYNIIIVDKYDTTSFVHSGNIKKILKVICLTMPKVKYELKELIDSSFPEKDCKYCHWFIDLPKVHCRLEACEIFSRYYPSKEAIEKFELHEVFEVLEDDY